jgi:hypothetical protein
VFCHFRYVTCIYKEKEKYVLLAVTLFFVFWNTAMPAAENEKNEKKVVRYEHLTKYRKDSSYIKSVSRRLQQLPDSLYDIICNDYLGHYI